MGGIFCEKFFGRKLRKKFGRNSLGGILCLQLLKLFEYGRNWFVCQDFGFCKDFVSMRKEGREEEF